MCERVTKDGDARSVERLLSADPVEVEALRRSALELGPRPFVVPPALLEAAAAAELVRPPTLLHGLLEEVRRCG